MIATNIKTQNIYCIFFLIIIFIGAQHVYPQTAKEKGNVFVDDQGVMRWEKTSKVLA